MLQICYTIEIFSETRTYVVTPLERPLRERGVPHSGREVVARSDPAAGAVPTLTDNVESAFEDHHRHFAKLNWPVWASAPRGLARSIDANVADQRDHRCRLHAVKRVGQRRHKPASSSCKPHRRRFEVGASDVPSWWSWITAADGADRRLV